MNNNLLCGADIDAKKFVICFLNNNGDKIGNSFSLPNSLSGINPPDGGTTLAEFIMKHGKNRFNNPKEVVQKIKAMARESYRIRPELAKSVNLVLAMTLKNIKITKRNQ
jgi:hypothetical protein